MADTELADDVIDAEVADFRTRLARARLDFMQELAPGGPHVAAGASNRGCSSLWSAVMRDRDGRLKFRSVDRPNLRTNIGNDWQAAAMEGHANKGESGIATATSATSLTKSGATFPTTGSPAGYAGHMIAAGPNASGTGATVYAVVISNTGTVITVDRWVDAGSPFAAGTTPNATCNFQVLPGMAPAWFLALSSTVQSGGATDTTLAGELTSNGFTRTNYTTLTHTTAASAYSLANTFTASGSATINSEALFNASSTTAGGVMPFENAMPTPPAMISGDTLAETVTVNY
jgi:hypothetical protein